MKSYIKYGLYFSAAMVVFSLLTYGLGLDMKPIGQKLNWVVYLILLVVLIMGIKFHRDSENGGFLSFGQAFKFGEGVTFIGAIISALYVYIYTAVLNPAIIDYSMEQAEEQMVESGVPESQIEMQLEMTEKFMSAPMFALFTFLGLMFFGTILTLIVSGIMKKDNPNPSAQAADVLDS